jgi:flagellar biosynthesis protein FlhG
MSVHEREEWLLSHKSFSKKAVTIAVTGGKGGVGKTTLAIKMSKTMAENGHRVLLIDCDFNLSNTTVKLNLPLNNNFGKLLNEERPFDECLVKSGNLHILPGCNGDFDIHDMEDKFQFEKLIIDFISREENNYDFIFLDAPAGISKQTLTLNAYADHRVVVVTPDRSSITDSYSLIKILNVRYGIKENHLMVNKIASPKQYKKMIASLTYTANTFLTCSIRPIGGVFFENIKLDEFDRLIFENNSSKINQNFHQVVSKFSEESLGVVIPKWENHASSNSNLET